LYPEAINLNIRFKTTDRQTDTCCCLFVCPFVFQSTYFLIIQYLPLLLKSVNRTVTL